VGLPKSGTTSLQSFLNSLEGYKAVSFVAPMHNLSYPIPAQQLRDTRWRRIKQHQPHLEDEYCFIGELIQRALVDKLPPLAYLLRDGVNAVVEMNINRLGLSIWPQIDALEIIVGAYPLAKYVHTVRNIPQHFSSIMRWGEMGDNLEDHGMLARFPGQSSNLSREQNIEMMIHHARDQVRSVFKSRPHYHYLEIDIAGNSEAGARLSDFLGVPSRPMPHENENHAQKSIK